MKYLFLPDLKNRKRAPLLRQSTLLGYIAFILFLIFSTNIFVFRMPSILGYAENIRVSDLLHFTNEKRKASGVDSLNLNTDLSKAAEAKAKHMFQHNYWAHTAPDGTEPWDFIIASGYDYLYAGENLAVDFSESKNVVDAWYQSPSHKENLISGKYTDIGFAVVNGELEGRKTTLVVQMFGYPRVQPHLAVDIQPNVPDSVGISEPSAPVPQVLQVEQPAPVPVEVPELFVDETFEDEVIEDEEFVEVASIEDREVIASGAVLSATEVFNVSRYLAIIMGLFLTAIFAIDGYYVKQAGIFRISGHTALHILLLMLAIAGIWYTHTGLVL